MHTELFLQRFFEVQPYIEERVNKYIQYNYNNHACISRKRKFAPFEVRIGFMKHVHTTHIIHCTIIMSMLRLMVKPFPMYITCLGVRMRMQARYTVVCLCVSVCSSVCLGSHIDLNKVAYVFKSQNFKTVQLVHVY